MLQDPRTEVRRQSFGAISEDYDRYRPGPADVAVDWLLPHGAADVLELGAGTGALTRMLVSRVPHVVAVEPDERMRAVLARRAPEASVVAGQAEDIPADDTSFDVVMAASAWHWVDERMAVPEVARVLRPGGWLSLLWSGPDRSIDWMRSLWTGGEVLTDKEKTAMDSHRRERHVVDLGLTAPFSPPKRQVFKWSLPMSRDQLVGLVGTYSNIITLGEQEREAYLTSIARFLDSLGQFADADVIDIPMRCLCWRAERR
jgi:SAM-dependent methyltransferase